MLAQPLETAQNVGDPVASADRLGRVDRPAAGEHREAGKERPFRLVEEVVAPLDDLAQ